MRALAFVLDRDGGFQNVGGRADEQETQDNEHTPYTTTASNGVVSATLQRAASESAGSIWAPEVDSCFYRARG